MVDESQKEQGKASDSSVAPEESSRTSEPRMPFDSAKMMLLFNASKALASTTDVDQLLKVIVEEVRTVLHCEGAGVLLYDEELDDFYWRIVQDKESFLSSTSDQIRIPKDRGVCGWVFNTGEPALVHDAASDPRLYRPVEDKSGFTTRTMVCVPLQTRDKRLGVLYALNKLDGSFTEEDVEIMVALAGSVALALENASYYESLVKSHHELERLNRVKNKMLNHLSHELKTPLAIVEASLRIMEKKLRTAGIDPVKYPFSRIIRNLERLKTIEKQVGHIVEEREYPQREVILSFMDYLPDFMEIREEEEPALREALEILRKKLEDTFPTKVEEMARVSVEAAFRVVEFRVNQMKQDRDLDIEFMPADPAVLKIQPQIMISVIGGLVRNAVENTPDQGKVIVKGEMIDSGYRITVHDYGVGIPESEQPNIFEGFYPIQETDMYSSGRRYGFNAGGTGTDLLKIKIFSQRFGFNVRFRSTRCSCIPTTRDLCPGDITKCAGCQTIEDCFANGGTEFVIDIPAELVESDPVELHTAAG